MKDAIISLAWLINDVSIHYNKLSETTFQKSTLISKTKINNTKGTSLVVQWLRIYLRVQGGHVLDPWLEN